MNPATLLKRSIFAAVAGAALCHGGVIANVGGANTNIVHTLAAPLARGPNRHLVLNLRWTVHADAAGGVVGATRYALKAQKP